MSARTDSAARVKVPSAVTAPPSPRVRPARWEALVTPAVGVVLVLAVGFRFVTRSQLWLDEALTADLARLPLGRIGHALRMDGAPPLYYWLEHLWIQAFGTGNLAVRSLAGVCSVATLPAAWFAGRRLGGRQVAWLTVVVLAVSPYAIRYATENRMYSFEMLLVVTGYLAVVRVVERPTLGRGAAVALLAAALLYTQYWSFYLIGVVGLGAAWNAFRARTVGARRAGWTLLGAFAGAGVLFLPWLGTFRYQLAHTGTPWGSPKNPLYGIGVTALSFANAERHADTYLLIAAFVLLPLLALSGRALDGHRIELDLRTRPGARAVITVGVATLLVGLTASWIQGAAYESRYAAVVLPFLALTMAAGVAVFTSAAVRTGVAAFLVVVGFAGGMRAVLDDRTQAQEGMRIVAAEAHRGDVVVYCPDQLGPSGSRLLEGVVGLHQYTFPDLGRPDRVNWVDYTKRMAATNPVSFASEVLARTPPGATIWLEVAAGYEGLEGKCETLAAALAGSRAGHTRVVSDDVKFFEFQGLIEYPPS